MNTLIFVDGFSGDGKTTFIKKFIHSCRGKNLMVVNIEETMNQKKHIDINPIFADSEYHQDNFINEITVYQVQCAEGEINETLDKIQENISFLDEENKKAELFIFDGGDIDRYLSIDIKVFVMEPLPEKMNLYNLEKILTCPEEMHTEICKKAGIDPKQIKSILPADEDEIEKYYEESDEEEELIEISDEQAKELALIYGKAILDYRLQRDFWPLKSASVIIINKFKTNTQAEVDHTLQEIKNMLDKENVYKKPSIFICDLSEPKQESQVKAFNRVKRLIRKNNEINIIFGF